MSRSPNVSVALALAAALAGCGGSSPPCRSPRLIAYWRPGGAPQAGFVVPGLAAANLPAQLDCARAGVVGVRVFTGTPLAPVPCSGGTATCVDADTWRCGIDNGGIAIAVAGPGTYDLQVDAYGDPQNSTGAKYTQRQSVTVGSCGDTAVGVFSQGLGGTMDLDYIFRDPPVNCDNISGSNIEWQLVRGTGPGAPLVENGVVTCGALNPFPANGGNVLAAGVYTINRIAEVTVGTAPRSIHALCNAVIVHAGDEVVGSTAPIFLDLPTSTAACF